MTDFKNKQRPQPGFSRRDFLRGSGAVAAATALQTHAAVAAEQPGPEVVRGEQTILLRVNGKDRTVKVEPRTTLLEVLRQQLELTGAKPVSRDGESGACTVLIDGKPMTASTILALSAVGKQIATIESLGGEDPDELCRAFVEHDATQCGFCTPGFVVAVRAFLDKHPQATEAEIRGAERKSLSLRHLCEHHPGGDRGRQRRLIMAEYYWPKRDKARTIGKATSRVDGLLKVTGAAKYTYDVQPKNLLIAKALGCPHAHCRIRSLDSTAAEKTPGVVQVFVFDHAKPGSEITYQGELLVAVAAESEGAAAEGLSRIKIDYEVLEAFTPTTTWRPPKRRRGRPRPAAKS